jgi:hypothetical protein
MAGKTRPLSTLVENQLPQFISDEYPQFVEFVKKYYEQLETKGQPLDIINNFVEYLDIDTYDKEILKSYTELSAPISDFATTINVVDTTGFPESNGYILIDDEAIFYSSKTATSFLNCYRNVSATTRLGDLYSSSEVTTAAYTDYNSNYPRNVGVAHSSSSIVKNISNLFLYAFVRSFESQYLASFPEESLKPEVDKKVLIKNIKQFYKSKGTDQSIKFIFSSIIAKEPEDIPSVYYPKDFTIKPSGGEWVKSYSLKAKIISGDPYKLIGKRITQSPDLYDSNITNAFAIIDSIANLGSDYYEIILSEKSIVGEFKIASETFLTKTLNSVAGTGSSINVYSTLGWSGERGKVFIGNEEIVYEGKTINQFKILSRGQNPDTYPVSNGSSKIPVYTSSTVSGTYVENGEQYVVRFLILGVLYNLNTTNSAPYSRVGDLVEQLSPGFITRDAVIYDKSISNVRWKINESFVAPLSSTNPAITSELSSVIADVSAVFEDANYYYIASSGIPSHDIGLASWEILKDQKQLRLIKKTPEKSTEIYKTPVRDIGILVNGVTVRSYKDDDDVVFGGVTEINIQNKGSGYKNAPFILIEEKLGVTTEAKAISYLSGESVDRIVVTDPGSGYFPPNPLITITSGRNAVLRAVVTAGKVTSIVIVNPGEYYSSAPEIRIIDKTGKGKFARYKAIVSSNGQIVDCVQEDAGKFYTQDNIEIQVVPIGSGATATSEVRKWKKNRFYKLRNLVDSSYGYFFQNIDAEYGNGYSYIGNPKKLRIDLGDNLSSTEQVPSTLLHSPILGFAYDGNPIYGPYGYSDAASASSSIARMVSSYSLKLTRLGGPGTDLYPLGSLIEDYQYIHRYGTLDENNGRFCVTPDYPNGTYAYFITIAEDNTPVFPYIIGENYYSLPVDSNYTKNVTQNEIPKIASRLKTANIPSNGLYSSAYISEVTSGQVSSADIQYSSDNFSVNSLVEVDYSGNTGSGVVAYVDSIKGKSVNYIQNYQTKCIKILTSATSYFYDGQLLKQSNSVYGTIVGNVFDSKTIVLKNVVGTFDKNVAVYSDIKVISVIVDKSSNYTQNSIIKLKNGKTAIINSLNNSVINVSSNPFINGEPIVFSGSFSEVIADKQYYVRDSGSSGFKISETLNGSAITITNTSNIISTAVGQKAKGTILERIEEKNSVKIRIEDGVFDTDQNYYLESSTLTDTVGSKIFLLNNLSENIPIFAINDNIALVKTSTEHKLSINDKVTIDINPNDAITEKIYYVRKRLYQTCNIISPQIYTKINDSGIGRILVLNSGGYVTKVNGNLQTNGDYANGANQTYTNVELIFLDQTKCRNEYGEVVGSSSTAAVIGKPGNTNNARATVNVTNGVVTSISITSKGLGYVTGDILTCVGSTLGKPSNSLNTQVLKVKVDHVGISSTNTAIKLFSVQNISVDDLLLIEKEIVKITNVNSLTNTITVQRAQNSTVSVDHSNSTDVIGYQVNYRLSYPYVLGSGTNSAIIKNYDVLSGKLEVVYPIGVPVESISILSEGYNFYDQSSPRKLITISSVVENPTYKFEFSKDTNDSNYQKNPIIDIQKYYIYKFDTSSSTLSGTFLEFSPSVNYNILTNESIKSSIKPGSSGSYIKLKIGFGSSLATNTYQEKVETNFTKFYYFDKSNLTDSEKSYINLIGDPLQGEKIVNYVTPQYFTYDLASIPQWDGSGTISYTTESKTAIGKINSISISSGGINLTKLPTVIGIRCSQYTEAEIDCSWSSETQNLLSVKVVTNGSGYSKPKAIISYGDGTEAEFIVSPGINGSISGITLKNPGKNYTFKPTIKVIETDVKCYLESSNIGAPKSIKISANGYGFYNDKTISNTYKSYDILILKNIFSNSFVSGEEIVQYEGGIEIARGKITVDGYTDNSNILKIITLVGKFKQNLQITGLWKNNTAIVKKIFATIFSPDIKSYVDNAGKYFSEKSILGINTQKLSDSFYYQDYSYIIKSKTSINDWKTLVTETTHPAGFKVFGELAIENPPIPAEVKEVKKEIVSIVQLWDENTNHVRVLSQNTRRQITTNILKLSELTVQNGKGSVFAPTYDTGETVSYEFTLQESFNGYFDQSGKRAGRTQFTMKLGTNIPLSVSNINNLFITLDGIFQEPGKAYTILGDQITFIEAPLGYRNSLGTSITSQDYVNGVDTPSQKFVGRFVKFKDEVLNTQYFKKIKNISNQFDGIKTAFDLYYEDTTSVELSSFENLLVFMDGVIQQNGVTPVFPADRSYYIKRTVTPNQIVFVEPPKTYENTKQSFYAYNVGSYERLTIDTEYIDDMKTGPFMIKSPLTNKVVTVDEDRNVMVFVDGVLQKRTKSYQIRGAAITFTEPLRKNQKINIIYLYGRDYVKSLVAFNFETTPFLNYFKIAISTPIANFNISSYNLICYQGNSLYDYSAIATLRYFQRVTDVPGVTYYLYYESAQNKKFVNTLPINFANPKTYNIVSGATISPSEIVSIDNFATDGDTLNLLKKTSLPPADFIRVGDQIKIDGENEFRKVLTTPTEVIKTQYRNNDDANVNYLGKIGVTNYNGEASGQGLDVTAVIDTNPISPTYTQVISLQWNNKNWTAYYENGIPPTAGGYGYQTYPILKFVPQPGRDSDGNLISEQPAQGGGAEGYVITNGNEVIDVILTNRGSGYITPPKIYVTRQYKVKRVLKFENTINFIIQPNKISATNLVAVSANSLDTITKYKLISSVNSVTALSSSTTKFQKTEIISPSSKLAEIKNTTFTKQTTTLKLSTPVGKTSGGYSLTNTSIQGFVGKYSQFSSSGLVTISSTNGSGAVMYVTTASDGQGNYVIASAEIYSEVNYINGNPYTIVYSGTGYYKEDILTVNGLWDNASFNIKSGVVIPDLKPQILNVTTISSQFSKTVSSSSTSKLQLTFPVQTGFVDTRTYSTLKSNYTGNILGNRWGVARNTLFVDTGAANVSGISIQQFNDKYPGVTIQDFENYDLNSVLLPTCPIPWNDAYPSINEYGSKLQTANLPSSSGTGVVVYGNTKGFPSSGIILINKELITYTGKLSDRFTGCTRGAYNSTISAHTIGDYMRTVSAPV